MNKDINLKIEKNNDKDYFQMLKDKLVYSKDKILFEDIINVLSKHSNLSELCFDLKSVLQKTKFDNYFIMQGINEKSNCFLALINFISETVKNIEKIIEDFADFKIDKGFDIISFNKDIIDFVCNQIINNCSLFNINLIELKSVARSIIFPYRQEMTYGATKKERSEKLPTVIRKILSEENSIINIKNEFNEILDNLRFSDLKYALFLKNNTKLFTNILCKIKIIVSAIENLENKGYKIDRDFNNKTLNNNIESFVLGTQTVKFNKEGFLTIEQGEKIFTNNRKKKTS